MSGAKGISGNWEAQQFCAVEISETGLWPSQLSSLHIIWTGDEEVRGVEKPRNKYYLDETEAQRDGIAFRVPLHVGTGKLVPLKSQFWAFWLGVGKMMSFNMEVAIQGSRGVEQRRQTILESGNITEFLITGKKEISWRQSGPEGIDLWLSELVLGEHAKSTGRRGIIENDAWENLGVMGWNEEPFPTKEIFGMVGLL